MKAPDKVYIDDLAIVNDCTTKISTTPLSNFSEYIRKDVLLKWAEEMKDAWECYADISYYQEFIDKINSI